MFASEYKYIFFVYLKSTKWFRIFTCQYSFDAYKSNFIYIFSPQFLFLWFWLCLEKRYYKIIKLMNELDSFMNELSDGLVFFLFRWKSVYISIFVYRKKIWEILLPVRNGYRSRKCLHWFPSKSNDDKKKLTQNQSP